MTLDVILVNAAVAIMFVSTLARNWLVARGSLRPVYWLMIVIAASSAVLNIMVAVEKPAYGSLLVFNLLSIQSVYCAIVGLRRLSNERRLG